MVLKRKQIKQSIIDFKERVSYGMFVNKELPEFSELRLYKKNTQEKIFSSLKDQSF
jgi:hypothetical protein